MLLRRAGLTASAGLSCRDVQSTRFIQLVVIMRILFIKLYVRE